MTIGHGSKLGRKMEQAIIALLKCRTVDETAESIGISPKTLHRRQKLPEFDRAYRDARVAAFRQSLARLPQSSVPAVTVLRNMLADPKATQAGWPRQGCRAPRRSNSGEVLRRSSRR